jgi:hypothetical protein
VGQGQQGVFRKDMRGQEQIKKKSNKGNDGEKHQAKKDMGLGIENKGEDRKTIVKRRTKTCKGKAVKNKNEIKRGRKGWECGHTRKEERKTGGREFRRKGKEGKFLGKKV